MTEDEVARRLAAEAKQEAIIARTLINEHKATCDQLRREMREMLRELQKCITTVRDEIHTVTLEADRARQKIVSSESTMWLRVSWGVIGALSTAVVGLLLKMTGGI